MSTQMPTGVPPGVPESLITPTGNVPAIGIPNSQDYARLIFAAPYFEQIPIAEIIQPSVTEAVENVLPSLVPPYVDGAVLAGIQQYAVLLTGSTMSGPLFLNPLMPTADSQAATKAYVDTMLATAGIPEVPPVPTGQIWGRETGQWVPIDLAGGSFLPLAGGSMQGNINMSGNTLTNMAAVPAMPNGAAPAQWVLNQIASVSLYQGTWDADTNVPDLTQLSVRVNGYTWIAITTSVSGVVIGAAIPGLQGMTIYNGDTIIYSTVQGQFSAIHAGGLSLPEADARYVQLAGSQMSGSLLLNADATQNMQAVTFQQLEAAVANTVTPDAPADGQAYARVGVGTNRWVPAMPLAGGIFTGAVTLAGPGAAGNNPVTVTQLNSAISAAQAGFLPIAGGTMTGALVLNGNATANLNAVPLQQLNATLNTYAPLQNPAFTGVPTVPNVTPPTSSTNQIANTAFVQSALGPYATTSFVNATFLPLVGGTLSGQLNGTNANFTGTVGAAGGSAIGGVSFTGGGNVSTPGTVTATNLQVAGGPYWVDNAGYMSTVSWVQTPNIVAQQGTIGNAQFFGGAQANQIQLAGDLKTVNTYPVADYAYYSGVPGIAWFEVNSYVFAQASDPRLKKNIVPAPAGALARVCAIPVRNFHWLAEAESDPLHTGWDATEVQTGLPEGAAAVVVGNDEAKTLSLSSTEMIAWLWQAVQELEQKVSAI